MGREGLGLFPEKKQKHKLNVTAGWLFDMQLLFFHNLIGYPLLNLSTQVEWTIQAKLRILMSSMAM